MDSAFSQNNYVTGTDQDIYLDYNGTTPIAPEVQDVIVRSLKEDWGNPRTTHRLGTRAAEVIATARDNVAQMIGGRPDDIIFTSGGTESNNMVIRGLCHRRKDEKVPKHVITTNVEHDSVLLPLKYFQRTEDLEVTEVDASEYNSITDSILNAIKDNTVLITVMAANNETGVLMPLHEIGQRLVEINSYRATKRMKRVVFHSDGAQVLGKEPINVDDLKLDCFTIVGHKFYGPRIGALWTKVHIPPLLFGGGSRDRPGTENTPMIAGLGQAAVLVNLRLHKDRQYMKDLKQYLEQCLQNLPVAAKINCANLPRLVNTTSVSFRVPSQIKGGDILSRCRQILAGVGAACHSGNNQASRVLINSGLTATEAATTIRISIGRDTHYSQIEEIIRDLSQAVSSLLWDGLNSSK